MLECRNHETLRRILCVSLFLLRANTDFYFHLQICPGSFQNIYITHDFDSTLDFIGFISTLSMKSLLFQACNWYKILNIKLNTSEVFECLQSLLV